MQNGPLKKGKKKPGRYAVHRDQWDRPKGMIIKI